MNWLITTYVSYLLISVALTVWVAAHCTRTGAFSSSIVSWEMSSWPIQ